MSEIDFDDDAITSGEATRLRQWAHAKCEAWNWNANAAEIAQELMDSGVDTDSHQFSVLCEVFDAFFNQPKMDVTEAIKQIMETFG